MTLTAAQQDSAAAKVLRRAEISRITRLLKSRLTLASYKTSRGWQNLALDSIAPRLTEERVFAAPLHKRPRTAPDDALHTAWAGALRLHQSSPAHRSGAYNPCSTHYESRSSPPQTPPRTRPPPTGEEGVDLLIYLATSPHASVGARFGACSSARWSSLLTGGLQCRTRRRTSTSRTLLTSRRRLHKLPGRERRAVRVDG